MSYLTGMNNAEYHASDGLSSSELKALLRSPEHFQAYGETDEQTPAMRFGSLFHTATLEPEAMTERYVIEPTHINKRTKAGKAEYAEFLKASEGKEVVTTDNIQQANCMAAAVFNDKVASSLFYQGEAETSIWWEDQVAGQLCKCRPDWLDIDPVRRIVVDLKSAVDASPGGFSRACFNFGYHISAAHYIEGIYRATGVHCSFVFVAVEKKYPFAVGVYMLDQQAMELGYNQRRRALDLYNECSSAGHWPGYSQQVNEISLPKYAFYQEG